MTQATDSGALGYNYEHFGLEQRVLNQLGGVGVGEPAANFTATRLDGTEDSSCPVRCPGRPSRSCG